MLARTGRQSDLNIDFINRHVLGKLSGGVVKDKPVSDQAKGPGFDVHALLKHPHFVARKLYRMNQDVTLKNYLEWRHDPQVRQ